MLKQIPLPSHRLQQDDPKDIETSDSLTQSVSWAAGTHALVQNQAMRNLHSRAGSILLRSSPQNTELPLQTCSQNSINQKM